MTNKQKTGVALVSSSVPAVSDGMSEPQEDTKKMLHHSKTEMMETLNDPCLSEKDEEPLIQIFVNRCGIMAPICLQQHPSMTIFTLKEILQDQLGIQREKQHLSTLKGILLRDELSLEEQHIEQDANLELSIGPGLLGGSRNRRRGGKQKKAQPKNQSNKRPSDSTPASRNRLNERQSDSSPTSIKPLLGRALSWLIGFYWPIWSFFRSLFSSVERREQPEPKAKKIVATGCALFFGAASDNNFYTYLRGRNDQADSTTNEDADNRRRLVCVEGN